MSHGIDEYYRVYSVEIRRARKSHVCDSCDRAIAPGDRYASVHIVGYDGSGETVKRCGPCEIIHEHLRSKGAGETWPAERLDCGEEYVEHWNQDPPENIAALAFVTDADAGRLLEPAP